MTEDEAQIVETEDLIIIRKVDGEWPEWLLEGLGRVAFARAVEHLRREKGPDAFKQGVPSQFTSWQH